jgi:hypothetical protein
VVTGAGGTSRRGLITAAATAAAGALVAGCGSTAAAASHPAIATRAPRGADARRADVRILTSALAMERQTIAAYAACIPLLPGSEARWARSFVVEEIQQAGALAKLIALAGATAVGENGEPAIGHPRDGAEATALLARLESEHITRYLGWIPRLSAGTLRAGVASILASDAQHVTALRRALGRPALGSAFVLGAAGAP